MAKRRRGRRNKQRQNLLTLDDMLPSAPPSSSSSTAFHPCLHNTPPLSPSSTTAIRSHPPPFPLNAPILLKYALRDTQGVRVLHTPHWAIEPLPVFAAECCYPSLLGRLVSRRISQELIDYASAGNVNVTIAGGDIEYIRHLLVYGVHVAFEKLVAAFDAVQSSLSPDDDLKHWATATAVVTVDHKAILPPELGLMLAAPPVGSGLGSLPGSDLTTLFPHAASCPVYHTLKLYDAAVAMRFSVISPGVLLDKVYQMVTTPDAMAGLGGEDLKLILAEYGAGHPSGILQKVAAEIARGIDSGVVRLPEGNEGLSKVLARKGNERILERVRREVEGVSDGFWTLKAVRKGEKGDGEGWIASRETFVDGWKGTKRGKWWRKEYKMWLGRWNWVPEGEEGREMMTRDEEMARKLERAKSGVIGEKGNGRILVSKQRTSNLQNRQQNDLNYEKAHQLTTNKQAVPAKQQEDGKLAEGEVKEQWKAWAAMRIAADRRADGGAK